jgi:acetyltransferase-like isoleucine patch superfamily enzyme
MTLPNPYLHPLSHIETSSIGVGTSIWQFCVILREAKIGSNCNICSHCFIENNVLIGSNVTIKNGCLIYDGTVIEDNVFIGPNAVFANDKYPRSKQYLDLHLQTTVQEGASIGSGAIIMPGVCIGSKAIVGAGAIVTKSVPDGYIVAGNPARQLRSLN